LEKLSNQTTTLKIAFSYNIVTDLPNEERVASIEIEGNPDGNGRRGWRFGRVHRRSVSDPL